MTTRWRRLWTALFGDRLGIVVFLGAVVVYGLCWRGGVLINDSYTVANALVAVSEGHLSVDRAVYGPGLETPGMSFRDGAYYGRNYGQVVTALPFVAAVQMLAIVADLRVAIAGVWALGILVLVLLVGRELGYPTYGVYLGSGLALIGFGAAVIGATPIEPDQHYLLALQVQTMFVAAFAGVFLYRLLARAHGRQVGFAAGIAATIATPVGFWALFPKRHAFVTLCAVLVAYFLYRSRENGRLDTRFRMAAYAVVGFTAWISAIEGAILLFAVLAVDVPTGGRDLRSLVASAGSLVVASAPMFLTNLLVVGNPFKPPRFASVGRDFADSGGTVQDSGGTVQDSGGTVQDSGGLVGSVFDSLVSEALNLVWGLVDISSVILIQVTRHGMFDAATDGERLYRVFIRSGYVADVAVRDSGEAIRLAFFEAMPLAAGLIVVPLLAVRADWQAWARELINRPQTTSIETVDGFAIVYAVCLILFSLPSLPVHAQITARYLMPVFLFAVYGLVRIPSIRQVIIERPAMLTASYASGIFIGGQLLVLYLWSIDASRGEAVQAHALVGLLTAGVLAGWVLSDGFGLENERAGAVAVGLAAAAGTVFVVLAGLWHFDFVGARVLPLG